MMHLDCKDKLQEVTEEKRRKISEDIKLIGNEAFKNGDFKQAEEYYTSAIMQCDKVGLVLNKYLGR